MLELDRVISGYGSSRALHEVSLTVPRGSLVTVLGANGAGKSTLLRVASGLLPIWGGDIKMDGRWMTRKSTREIVRAGVVHCPEGRQIFSQLTVYENLQMGGYLRDDRKAAKRSMDQVFSYFPRLKERVKQRAGTLSGGEQQMLAIGRSLMASPRLLMLDEPSLGIAPKLVQEILGILGFIQEEGTAVLLVEQNARLALQHADYAYVLDLGRVVMEGAGSTLAKDSRIEERYFGARDTAM
ncbi:ABC transporter ATP-binding protein [Ferroacidibacillus organovorans]|uniref:ABC transporter ATP-binding protein n=1 Tax=Ferroacidibacillus organovorans TaxID=1765683 RepID=A0A1V4EWZ1_9BACL|nr:ABC transporter ATP-binding protein [Ferroacidibacillus organovorans]OAG93168.1 ABC transporter ATP-binding protein [Ferroacidibacillus organovorans]OPG17264.1 ABC transporter ATP-binding protein [Ferroacidibacillus organovorans]